MRIIGLTGGIASGKSTVAEMLRARGAEILDADAIYHALVAPVGGAPSPLARAIAARFADVLEPDGSLARKRLAALVFADAAARQELGEITHPAVAAELVRRCQALSERGVAWVIYDVPLLFENGLERGMDGVIVVWVPRDVQLARLIARDGLSRAQAEARLAAQLPLADKKRRARWVVDNQGSRDATRAQVEALYRELATPADKTS